MLHKNTKKKKDKKRSTKHSDKNRGDKKHKKRESNLIKNIDCPYDRNNYK